jgi:hypothetical protein
MECPERYSWNMVRPLHIETGCIVPGHLLEGHNSNHSVFFCKNAIYKFCLLKILTF